MLRFEAGCWYMWTLLRCEGAFRWRHTASGEPSVEVGRAALVMLLSSLNLSATVRSR